MKKISLFALAMTAGMALFAQDAQPRLRTEMERRVYFGIKAGPNFSTFRQENYTANTNINSKTSLHGGFFVSIPVGRTVSFVPEILYNSVGAKMTTSNLGVTTSMEQDLKYISLPLMFKVKAPGGFFAELGPQASYLISAKSQSGNTETNNKSTFDNFDVALNGGIGFTSRVGLGVHGRYSWGLSNILEDGGGNNSPNNGPELKNNVISVGLHYMFGAGR
jgi:hypothetical protein